MNTRVHSNTPSRQSTQRQVALNIFLWVLQSLLAVTFLRHGWLYLAPPADRVAAINAFIAPALRMFIGLAEVLAAFGLIFPGVTRVLPSLTSWAAAGLMLVMLSASVLHMVRGEVSSAVATAISFFLTAFVAYMRWKVKPISGRYSTSQALR